MHTTNPFFCNILTYNKNNLALFEVNPSKAIKYSNRTIVELLDITYDEQQFMLQLIDDYIATQRIKKHNYIRGNIKNYKNKQNSLMKKENLINQINNLRYNYLLSNKQISMKLEISLNTIIKYCGKDPKFITIGKMNNQKLVLYYSKLGYSNKTISSIINISKRQVIKYKNK